MSTGGYNASYEEAPTGFGSEGIDESRNADRTGGGVSSAPLVGIDYKKLVHHSIHSYLHRYVLA